MHHIEITVLHDGTTKLETKGFQGASCRDADKWIRDSLGITETDTPTQEMYVAPRTNTVKARS